MVRKKKEKLPKLKLLMQIGSFWFIVELSFIIWIPICFADIVDVIRTTCMQCSNVNQALTCSTVDHYASTYGDKGWGCGFRNIQMMLSALLRHTGDWKLDRITLGHLLFIFIYVRSRYLICAFSLMIDFNSTFDYLDELSISLKTLNFSPSFLLREECAKFRVKKLSVE